MGQYYLAIILADKEVVKPEVIRIFMEMYGSKLTEHCYINNPSVNSFEYQLTKEGMFYKSRVVWAGDYANNEDDIDKNLYCIAKENPDKYLCRKEKHMKEYRYIINHTKKQFVDKQKHTLLHPLPLLTAEGNGRGGGDYYGRNEKLIGIWARDLFSIEKEIPEDYEEFECEFDEF
jgi:hypothetical protein